MSGRFKSLHPLLGAFLGRSLLFLLVGTCLLFQAQAADYHVKADGDDSLDGLTDVTAWRTLTKVNGRAYSPGDRVLFRRGDTWVGDGLKITSSGTAEAPIFFGDYGAGAKPVIDVNGKASTTGVLVTGADHLIIQNLVILNANGAGNPAGMSCVDVHHLVVRGIDVNLTAGAGINFSQGGHILVDGCTVTRSGNGAIYCRGSDVEPLHDVIIQNCTVYDLNSSADGFTLHQKSAPPYPPIGANFILRNNVAYNCREEGFDITSGTNVLLENNVSHSNDSGAISLGHSARYVTIRNHRSENEPLKNTSASLKIAIPDVTIEYSTFIGSSQWNKPIVQIIPSMNVNVSPVVPDAQPENVVLRNNVFMWNSSVNGNIFNTAANQGFNPTIQNLTMVNNVWANRGSGAWTMNFASVAPPPNAPGFQIDHNLYFQSAGAKWNVAGASHDFTSYRETFGRDAHGMEADPQFTNVTGGDFTLQSTSPAIDAGAELGLTRDLAGTSVPQGGAPDLGAYEFSLAPAAPSGLTATAVSPSQIDLVWTDNATDETAFRIQRKSGSGGVFADTVPASVGANTVMFSDTAGVAGGTTYHYQVRAENASGYSVWSPEAAATTPEADLTPPVFGELTASPDHLWPPNHKMVTVTLTVSVTDDRDPAPVTRILSVSSSEPDTGEPDWQITGDLTVKLRAERAGNGPGRLYTVTVQSTDASGNSSTAEVLIPVAHNNDTQKPTVSLVSPFSGSAVGGSAVAVSASASDNRGVVGVQFKLNGANLGIEDTSAPYALTWNTTNVPDGSHGLTAVARDENGNLGTSAPVSVLVDNTPPAVTVTTPGAGAILSGSDVGLAASATDNVSIAGVRFLLDGNALGAELTAAPYALHWDSTTVSDGQHVITALARDGIGNSTVSPGIAVRVDNLPPIVALTAPAAGSVVGVTNVQLTATATDSVGVAGVQFLSDGQPVGPEDTTAPYTITWDASALDDGPHVLTAVARDLTGRTSAAQVTVTVDNTPPTVAITAPAAGSTLEGTVTVSAEANDVSSLAGVQFKLNDANLGAEDTTAPFSVNWSTATAGNGSHTLTAVARDTAGNTATSNPVSVTVANAAPLLFEAELLTIAETSDTIALTDAAGASNGRYMLQNSNLVGDYITYTVNVPTAGTYLITTGLATQGNRGIFQLSIDGANQGSPQDYYTPGTVALFTERTLGTKFLTAGTHSFRFLCTGRHASSGNRKHALDYITLTPQ